MRFLKVTPVMVFGLVGLGAFASWVFSRSVAEKTGFAGSAGVALWFLGFVLLAVVVGAIAALVALINRKRLTTAELACGALPLPLLLISLVVAFFVIT